MFAHESQVHRCDIDLNSVPPGALITYIQKGMQYMEAEANIDVSQANGGRSSSEWVVSVPKNTADHLQIACCCYL